MPPPSQAPPQPENSKKPVSERASARIPGCKVEGGPVPTFGTCIPNGDMIMEYDHGPGVVEALDLAKTTLGTPQVGFSQTDIWWVFRGGEGKWDFRGKELAENTKRCTRGWSKVRGGLTRNL